MTRGVAIMRRGLPLLVCLVGSTLVAAHVRLIYSENGNPLFWSSPDSISVVIHQAGSDDLEEMEHFPAIRNGIDEWNATTGTTARLVEDTGEASQINSDWASDSHHMVIFDESNQSGFFPAGAGVVAVTPISFFTSGKIIDADILFNGAGYRFTTSGTGGRFDVQDVVTHELGHLLGLDHSGCAGATMYPYVDPKILLHRSLSTDDAHGLRSIYPAAAKGRIWGVISRSADGSPVRGAWVVARGNDGRVAGAILSSSNGSFEVDALDPDTYTLYAMPLDHPVSSSNLTEGWQIDVDFEATVFSPVPLGEGEGVNMGQGLVGGDVSLSLGRVADDYPIRVRRGLSTVCKVRGEGLVSGSTLVPSDPAVSVANVIWSGSQVSFNAVVASGTEPGNVDLMAINAAGERDILCGGLEITPRNPSIGSVTPVSGDSAGGTTITISGSFFNSGARVVLGDQVYEDGVLGGCQILDKNTIALTTRQSIPGTHDVVIIDSTGVEGRAKDAFQVTAAPAIDSVFPVSGNKAGGTFVTVSGDDFVAGATVYINGIAQMTSIVESLHAITFYTESGVPGGPYTLSVENPSGEVAVSAFSFSLKPDPNVVGVTPGEGDRAGGEPVTISGVNFTPSSTVIFGADPLTGAGGTQASDVLWIDSSTIQITTPPGSLGSSTVMVKELDTQQADILSGAFSFSGDAPGGGGGCGMVYTTRPPTWRGFVGGAGWLLTLIVVLSYRSGRQRLARA